jgi:anion-transporting  ArsA/GET3 family ATPase
MGKMNELSITLNDYNRRLERVEHLLDSMRALLSRTNDRVTAVLSNQKHYLRRRAPAVLAKQKAQSQMIKNAQLLLKRIEKIPQLSFQTAHKKLNSDQRHLVFMCTPNEARKLRTMVNIDFRQFNSPIVKKPGTTLNYSSKKK